ncbi:MAG: cytochrome c oxidase subunit II [Bacteroidota bacterium]|nr:cytochrome c oxidase subunit II [Bacteroidota bacterium]
MFNIPLFPTEASTTASRVDLLFFALMGIIVFFTALIFVGVIFFSIRYRQGSRASRKGATSENLKLELVWTIIPLCITMGIFAWASKLYFDMHVPPRDAMDIYVVGKQWMWYIQHPEGNREIDELHVPLGKPVRLILTSQDVIHDFFIPAFRVKQDVIPGRYTTEWFEATKVGEYHLFCAQYCGTGHAQMVGKVIVMQPWEYEQWLSGKSSTGATMSSSGEQLFTQFGCVTCHKSDNTGRGPSLIGLFGQKVKLQTGQTVVADMDYIRESILDPTAKVVATYQPVMPTFKNQIDQAQLMQLIEYVKSLGKQQTASKGK